MKRILFRADAKPSIGIGDLMSLIHLSAYLSDEWETYFIIRNYPAGVALVQKYSVSNVYLIDADIPMEHEVIYLNSFIKEYSIDILFFEITERPLSEYRGLDNHVKKACVNFDGQILDHMQLVVDWDVEANNYFTPKKHPNTRFLLGAEYVILPKEFYTHKVKKNHLNLRKNPKIIIAMGGADELNFTAKIVDAIIQLEIKAELTIVIGSGYIHEHLIRDRLVNSNLCYTIHKNVINMLDLYLSCDIGIGAGGLISSEMVATMISPILIATYEHQIARCQFFDDHGWAKYLGYRNFSLEALSNAIANPLIPSDTITFKTHTIVEYLNELM